MFDKEYMNVDDFSKNINHNKTTFPALQFPKNGSLTDFTTKNPTFSKVQCSFYSLCTHCLGTTKPNLCSLQR